MPRRNNGVSLIIGTIAIVLLIYWLQSDSLSTNSEFRKSTESALRMKDHYAKMGKSWSSDADMLSSTNSELEQILQKQHTDSLAAEHVGEVHNSIAEGEEEVSIAGRVKIPSPRYKDDTPAKYPSNRNSLAEDEEEAYNGSKVQKVVDLGREAAREELMQILKRSPIVVFSKSHCPYSRRAKTLLLETYTILPAPFVVELDLMTDPAPEDASDDGRKYTMGQKLQALLADMTGRKTVPNILVRNKSIGGSDDIAKLEADGELESTLKKLAGAQLVKVEKRKEDN